MPRKLPKARRFRHLLILFASISALAQQPGLQEQRLEVIALLQLMEQREEVKFSFVDDDLAGMQVVLNPALPLEAVLDEIRQQTQLDIRKLDGRYYTVAKSALVSVCARILDNYERNTLSGATVEVLGSSLGTVTGPDGSFRLQDIPRKAVISIRHIGYQPFYIAADQLVRQNPCSELLLRVRYQQLDEITVYKFLTTGLSKEPDGSILMNVTDFGLLPGLTEPDVLQTIQALPGIKSIDETVSDINIRGGTNDQNLLLWDGIKMYQSGHFFGLISAFNPYLTTDVEIIKNGASARYGDGLSGIISMKTHDQVERTYFGGAGVNLISGDLYAHLPLSDRLAFQFSARRSVTDFLNTPTYTNFSDRAFQDTQVTGPGGQNTDRFLSRDENFYFYDFSGKVLYDWRDNHQLRLNFLYIRNNLFYSEVLAADNSTNRSDLDQSNFALGARVSSQWTDALKSEVQAYYTQYDLDSFYETEASGQTLVQVNQVAESALKARLEYEPDDLQVWSGGYQFLETGITNTSDVNQPVYFSDVKDILYTHALFGEWQYRGPERRFQGRAGLRLNYLTNPGDFELILLEPRLSLHYKLLPHMYLEALGEFKNQASLQKVDLEQNFLGIEKRRWILADEQMLPVVTSRQGSLGLHYDRGNWLASLEGFYKEVDGINTDTQGFQNEYQFNGEIGKYWIYGFESLLNFKTETLSSWLGYTWNRNRFRFPDLDPSVFPNNLDIRHSISFGLQYALEDLKLGIGLNYRTGRPFTEPQPPPNDIDTSVFPNRVNFSAPNSSRLPEYFRADASAMYSFKLSETVSASAGASILNLTDRLNILNTYYRLNAQNEVETVESVSLGLTPNLSFRVQF